VTVTEELDLKKYRSMVWLEKSGINPECDFLFQKYNKIKVIMTRWKWSLLSNGILLMTGFF
jgi:hypothetical protein